MIKILKSRQSFIQVRTLLNLQQLSASVLVFEESLVLYFSEHLVYNFPGIANTHAVQECNMNDSPTLNQIHCTTHAAVDGT